jgi:thymidylate kinase
VEIKPAKCRRPLIVSFSGIDGAGKSTQIRKLCACLVEAGLHVRLLTFWDEVASLSRIRSRLSLRLFKGDPGVGTPENPVNRRDKNVQSPYLDAIRFVLYLFDAFSLKILTTKLRKSHLDVVVFDRYLFDELANLPMLKPMARAYTMLLARLGPRPDVAFLLDVDPGRARRRKPEYPLEFLNCNREAYLNLSECLGMIVIPDLPEHEVTARIFQELVQKTGCQVAWTLQPVSSQMKSHS